jgi:hypothetical protein
MGRVTPSYMSCLTAPSIEQHHGISAYRPADPPVTEYGGSLQTPNLDSAHAQAQARNSPNSGMRSNTEFGATIRSMADEVMALWNDDCARDVR